MKKKVWLAVILALLVLLAGCKRSSFANTIGGTLDNWRYDGDKVNPPRAIAIETYQNADFGDTLGFEVVSLPDAAAMPAEKFFTIDGWYGQIEFTSAAGLSLNVRVALDGIQQLSGTYSEGHALNKQTLDIGGMEVTILESGDGCALIKWVRGEFQYTLHSNKVQGVPPTADIETIVTGMDSALLADLAADSSVA